MKFLITNLFVNNFTGSEINALSLSEALIKLGHEVVVGTFDCKDPMAGLFSKKRIPVTNLLYGDVDNFNYDVIWGHHFPTMEHVILKKKWQPCKLLFSSLSYIMPVEAPPAFHADIPLFLSYSPVNTEVMIKNGIHASKIHYFPNYADESFFRSKPSTSGTIRKILIVSNHPPLELLEFKEYAEKMRITVDVIGWTGEPRFVDAELLVQYDLVITIGKTVIYCFAAQVPVYCYDHFGGQGYITEDNFELGLRNNFSGKGFNRHLTGQQVLEDVLQGFPPSIPRLGLLKEICKEKLKLEKNLAIVLDRIKDLPLSDPIELKKKYSLLERHHDAQPFWAQHFTDKDLIAEKLLSLQRETEKHYSPADRSMVYQQQAGRLTEMEGQLTEFENRIAELNNEIDSIKSSTSWKITKPIRLIKDVLVKLQKLTGHGDI